jgi:hypothetical protein
MAKKTTPSKKKAGSKAGAKKAKPKLKDLSPKPASTRMVVGGRRRYISG